jgi:hypothetical protein
MLPLPPDSAATDGPALRRLVGIGATTLLVSTAAIAIFWSVARPGEAPARQPQQQPQRQSQQQSQQLLLRQQHARTTFASTLAMAERIGCTNTFHRPAIRGSAADAGECTVSGVRVQLRVYPLPDQATAWLDGARGQEIRTMGASGGTWAALAQTTDRTLGNKALSPLTTP